MVKHWKLNFIKYRFFGELQSKRNGIFKALVFGIFSWGTRIIFLRKKT